MKKIFHGASTRGEANHGWLHAKHSFSFANYFNPERSQFRALRVLNDDTVAPGMGVGKHPHDNIEIITSMIIGLRTKERKQYLHTFKNKKFLKLR